MMLHGAIRKSSLGSNVTNFSEIPKSSSFCKFVHALESKCQLSRPANKVIRWFNETKADGKDFKHIRIYSTNYFRACSLFLGCVTPTVWTIGHVVPVHSKDVKSKYGKSLAITSMEGRDAKHISILRYSQNTNHGMRWQQIFCREFLSLI